MAVPKRKKGKSRTRSRKAQWLRMSAPALAKCTNCRETMRPHRVCPHCGQYKGREVIKQD